MARHFKTTCSSQHTFDKEAYRDGHRACTAIAHAIAYRFLELSKDGPLQIDEELYQSIMIEAIDRGLQINRELPDTHSRTSAQTTMGHAAIHNMLHPEHTFNITQLQKKDDRNARLKKDTAGLYCEATKLETVLADLLTKNQNENVALTATADGHTTVILSLSNDYYCCINSSSKIIETEEAPREKNLAKRLFKKIKHLIKKIKITLVGDAVLELHDSQNSLRESLKATWGEKADSVDFTKYVLPGTVRSNPDSSDDESSQLAHTSEVTATTTTVTTATTTTTAAIREAEGNANGGESATPASDADSNDNTAQTIATMHLTG